MKKKFISFLVVSLVAASLLGSVTISAAQEKESTDVNEYKASYAKESLVENEVSPAALPFVAGALAGGVIYDAAKAGVNAYNNMYQAAGGNEAMAKSYNAGKQYATYGPQSVEETHDFGR